MKTIKDIEKECEGMVFKLEDFINYVKSGFITDYDGIGYFHDGEEEIDISGIFCCDENILKTYIEIYPYVCWYAR